MADADDIDLLKALLAEELSSAGQSAEQAEKLAGIVIVKLQVKCGATRFYLPSVRQQREKDILKAWRESDGSQEAIKTIAQQHEVSERTVYNVIKRSRAKQKHRAAQSGFGSDEWVL